MSNESAKKEPFNPDWCEAVAKGNIMTIESGLRSLRFCLAKQPEVVLGVIEGLDETHPLKEALLQLSKT